jgi:hypothetical protein
VFHRLERSPWIVDPEPSTQASRRKSHSSLDRFVANTKGQRP